MRWVGQGVCLAAVPAPAPPGAAALTGMVWLPCSALMAACASAWEEYFTKAHPERTGEAESGPEGPEEGREVRGLRGGAREGARLWTGRIPEESTTGETQRPREKEIHEKHRDTNT